MTVFPVKSLAPTRTAWGADQPTGAEKGVVRVNRYPKDSNRRSISGPEEPRRTFPTDSDRKT